jgi:Na+/proline symporter
MRILNILSGIAVLLTTLAFAHLLHHYFSIAASHDDVHNPAFLAGMAAGVVVGVLSFVGGFLLLRRGR